MKQTLYTFLLLGFFSASFAQGSGSLFKPSKVSYFYPPVGATGWVLTSVQTFKYDQNGNATLVITKDNLGVPSRKDSNVFSPTSRLLENHRFVWDGVQKKYVAHEKTISLFDAQDRQTSYLSFQWTGVWTLVSGMEYNRTYDATAKEETEIVKMYEASSEKWSDYTKKVVVLDESGYPATVTHYSTDNQKNFFLYLRESYSGWHNYAKGISKSEKVEEYINGAWELHSSSTTEKSNDFWVKTETKLKGAAAGTYKILFDENASFREVLKQYGTLGWLNLSVFTRTGKVDKIVQNNFEGDVLKKTETDEREIDSEGNLIRETKRIQNGSQQTTSFNERLYNIVYDNRKLPLEQVSNYTSSEIRDFYIPIEKIVYSEYADVRLNTELDAEGDVQKETVKIFPNPGIGIFTVSENIPTRTTSVYNTAGVFIKNYALKENKLDISDLPTGLYQLQMETDKGIFYQKVVVVSH